LKADNDQAIEEQLLQSRANAGDSQILSAEDEELLKLVQSLRIKISIIGCGGGGSNTIRRLNQAGVSGATLVACNSDARHLLSIQAPNKVLLGRRSPRRT
jgi:cell division protein FtsZ